MFYTLKIYQRNVLLSVIIIKYIVNITIGNVNGSVNPIIIMSIKPKTFGFVNVDNTFDPKSSEAVADWVVDEAEVDVCVLASITITCCDPP